jgi:hypothetical protein
MAIREFLHWARTAPAPALAEGASRLARAFMYADLPEREFQDLDVLLLAPGTRADFVARSAKLPGLI